MRVRSLGMAGAIVLVAAALGRAGPVQLEDVSAEATWLAHVDVDAMRSSAVIERLYHECVAESKLAECFDKASQRWGMDPRKDLHALTLYGAKIARGHGVLIVRADMDKDLLLEKAEKAPHHATAKHGDREIHTWTHRKHGKKEKPCPAQCPAERAKKKPGEKEPGKKAARPKRSQKSAAAEKSQGMRGPRVEAPADLQTEIAGYRPGEEVRLTIRREGARKEIEVELGAFGTFDGDVPPEARRLIERFLEGRSRFPEDAPAEEEQRESLE